jgi:secretory phospholipase A2
MIMRGLGLLLLFVLALLDLSQQEPIPVVCTQGMTPAQNRMTISSNGCTGADFIELAGEEDFTSCCDEHDACYQVCGMTKKKCDMKFWECMEHMCNTLFPENKKCTKAANIYYIGTKTLGNAFYEDAQSDHCMCVDDDGINEHYKSLIGSFYTKNAPKSKSKFDWSKYEHFSPNKLYLLYNTLHEKYPKAIEHEGPRVRVGMEPPRTKTRPPKKVDPWGEAFPEVLKAKDNKESERMQAPPPVTKEL